MAVIKVCGECGSQDVTSMGSISWDVEEQSWVLDDAGDSEFGLVHCNDCDADNSGIVDKRVYFQPLLSDVQWRDAHMRAGSVFSSLKRVRCLFPMAEIKQLVEKDDEQFVIVE